MIDSVRRASEHRVEIVPMHGADSPCRRTVFIFCFCSTGVPCLLCADDAPIQNARLASAGLVGALVRAAAVTFRGRPGPEAAGVRPLRALSSNFFHPIDGLNGWIILPGGVRGCPPNGSRAVVLRPCSSEGRGPRVPGLAATSRARRTKAGTESC